MGKKKKKRQENPFQGHLLAGEEILWVGQPQNGIRYLFSVEDPFRIGFGSIISFSLSD